MKPSLSPRRPAPVVLACILALAGALAGCATPSFEAPVPVTPARETQAQLSAVRHWQAIAADHAAVIAAGLKASPWAGTPVQLKLAPGASPFLRNYRELLASQLVASGVKLRLEGSSDLQLLVGAEVVGFSRERENRIDIYNPLLFTSCGVAGMVGREARDWSIGRGLAVGTGALLAIDAWRYYLGQASQGADRPVPSHELVVSTTVHHQGVVAARRSDIYYLRDGDTALYVEPRPPAGTPSRQIAVRPQ
ncbi:hypothetical protein JI742_04990 [Piscinibacter sp. Jin2]|uniref:Lipoprotein n=1 Tax=Aquariibacter lacus TaxID=2801332 RepID=A0A9X0XD04_9BURK|nr:hypothetical protein [Piscinibacter lacus]MBL0719241.1 hypothetical protein [Piscinibacter lacus]